VGAALTRSPVGFGTSLALGVAGGGVSLFTDYRLSLSKLIPIEVHEKVDYGWSLAAIGAPFVLGYARKAPWLAATHVVLGLATLVGSLYTDYRAQRGVQWNQRPVMPAVALAL